MQKRSWKEEIINISYDNMTSCRNSDSNSCQNFFFSLIYLCVSIYMDICVYTFTYFLFLFPLNPIHLLCNIRCDKSGKPYILIFKVQDIKRRV